MVPAVLLLLGALTAVLAPRLLARARWPEREPVVALWTWQCVVGAVLLCLALSMLLSAAAAWQAVRGGLFAPAPHGVVDAYGLGAGGGLWATGTALALAGGGLWTGAMLAREILRARARRRAQGAELLLRAPLLPGEQASGARLVVLEGQRPDSWWLPGPAPGWWSRRRPWAGSRAVSWMPYWPTSRGTRRPGTTGCCTAREPCPGDSRGSRSSPRSRRRCTGWWSWPPTTWPRGGTAA